MKIEQQVFSLELAYKLNQLGAKQDSYFYWYGGRVLRANQLNAELRRHAPPVSAFTAAELGEELGIELTDQNESDSFTLKCGNAIDFWWASFGDEETTITPQFENVKFADALAELYIYLIDSNLMEKP